MSRRRPRLLLDAGEYPVSDRGASGLGVRLAELAEVLAGAFDVTVHSPGTVDPIGIGAAELATGPHDWPVLVREADAVLFVDVADPARLAAAVAAGLVVVSETAPPVEHAGYPSLLRSPTADADYRAIVAAFAAQVRATHHFVCRSDVERATLTGSIVALGRLSVADVRRSPTSDHLLTTVPIGFSPAGRRAAEQASATHVADVLWTGGMWSFYDPGLLVDAVAVCRRRGTDVSAAFLYGQPHPDTGDIVAGLDRRIVERGVADLVHIRRTPLGHRERDGVLKAARAFVCTARPGTENETAVRLRLRDGLLHGRPLVVDGHGATADEIRRNGMGHVLPESDPAALADALIGIVGDGWSSPHPPGRFEYPPGLYGLVERIDELVHRSANDRESRCVSL